MKGGIKLLILLGLGFLIFGVVSCSSPKKSSEVKKYNSKSAKKKNFEGDVSFDTVYYDYKSYKRTTRGVKSDRLDEIFRIACISNDRERVINLIQKGVNVNSRDQNGDTPLHLAVYYNNVEVVKILIRYGANPRIKNRQGFSSIDIARDKGYVEIYRLLTKPP